MLNDPIAIPSLFSGRYRTDGKYWNTSREQEDWLRVASWTYDKVSSESHENPDSRARQQQEVAH